jgi:hypothetical protein
MCFLLGFAAIGLGRLPSRLSDSAVVDNVSACINLCKRLQSDWNQHSKGGLAVLLLAMAQFLIRVQNVLFARLVGAGAHRGAQAISFTPTSASVLSPDT